MEFSVAFTKTAHRDLWDFIGEAQGFIGYRTCRIQEPCYAVIEFLL